MKRKKTALIIAGGSGKRLWPVSRDNTPKFLIKTDGKHSLLQQTFLRLIKIVEKENIFIITTRELDFKVKKEIVELEKQYNQDNVISEPFGRNTAPAILYGISKFNDEDIVAVFPADQVMGPESKINSVIEKAFEAALNDYIVTIGIEPVSPSTAYGYIKSSDTEIVKGVKEVELFTEKPDESKAKDFISEGNYFWNAGIFISKVKTIKDECRKYCPEVYNPIYLSEGETIEDIYGKVPSISIDYALMEKTKKSAITGFSGVWDDLGSWEVLSSVLENSGKQNNNTEFSGSNNVFVYSETDRIVSVIGLDDVIVADTSDALLVLKKGEGQRVKEIAEKINSSFTKGFINTDERPWGGYKILSEGKGYKVKILEVDVGQRLSLQKHQYRDEIWTVIEGKARITLEDKTIDISENETIEIKKGDLHRAENIGEKKLKILELATGDKIIEDDIIRLEDDYNR